MQARSQADGRTWAQRWRRWLTTLGLGGAARGSVRIKRLEVSAGRIDATVQVRSGLDHDVEIRLPLWSDSEWQTAVDALGSQAIYAAQLLAGDLPPELERALDAAGVQLLPARQDELTLDCSCSLDQRKVCVHVGAVLAALGELLPEDPWLLFRLRGRDQQGLLRSLHARTSDHGVLPLAAPDARRGGFYRAGNGPSQSGADLNEEVDHFWGNTKALEDFRPHVVAPAVELALLRRLGVPPLDGAGLETYDELAALYRRISQETVNLAYAVDNGETAHSEGELSAK